METQEQRTERMRALAERSAQVRRERKAAGQTVSGGSPQTQAQSGVAPDAADLQTLQAMIDAPKTLGSDRIRAIEQKQRILQRQQVEKAEQEHGPLVLLRNALDLLPAEQRVHALSTMLGVQGVLVSEHSEVQAMQGADHADHAPMQADATLNSDTPTHATMHVHAHAVESLEGAEGA